MLDLFNFNHCLLPALYQVHMHNVQAELYHNHKARDN